MENKTVMLIKAPRETEEKDLEQSIIQNLIKDSAF